MKQRAPRGLPPCSLSAQCLRLLDELDTLDVSISSMDDIQDERMLEQLREHIPTCPTCTATLAQARHIRAQQREALRNLLADSEQRVPPTTSQIFARVHSEERSAHQASAELVGFPLEETEITPQPEQLNGWHSPSAPLSFVSRPRMILRNVLTLGAVAALILASVALFGHMVLMRSHPSAATTPIPPTKIVQQPTGVTSRTTPPSSASPAPSAPVVGKTSTPVPASDSWNSVMIASSTANGWMVSNYNSLNGAGLQLNSQQLPAGTQFDGVSPDGKNLLYHFSSSDNTMYFTLLQLPNANYFYELNDDRAGNAIWFDNRYVLIATVESGVVKVDTQTGQAQPFLPTLKTANLKFVRNGFLYFIGGVDHNINALYRINLPGGVVEPLTYRLLGTNIWLSPDGSMIYFKTSGTGGLPGISAASSDGTNFRMLRQNAVPIGYAADNSLMIMQEVSGKFEVVKIGATSAQDQVVSADVAPNAISVCTQNPPQGIIMPICDNAVALAPDAHALVVQAYYADGSHQVLSVDLTTGKRVALQIPASSTSVQLIGWDKLLVQ